MKIGTIWLRALAAGALLLAANATARADDHPWLDPGLLAAAKQEGTATVYSSVNEEEELPQLQNFESATGLKIDYIRGSDVSLMARIGIEARAGKPGWDVVEIQAAESLPKDLRLTYAPS
jgi:ABC-type glycerol-3-phosphate transport system substrate-binding protein